MFDKCLSKINAAFLSKVSPQPDFLVPIINQKRQEGKLVGSKIAGSERGCGCVCVCESFLSH